MLHLKTKKEKQNILNLFRNQLGNFEILFGRLIKSNLHPQATAMHDIINSNFHEVFEIIKRKLSACQKK